MINRIEKRIVIGTAYLVFFLASATVIMLISPKQKAPATCFDNIQNQNEEGVDCGRSCAPCVDIEQKLLQKIITRWTKAFRVKQGIYDFAASIENPNFTYGGEDVSYRFVAQDNTGKELVSISGKTYILPNASRYVVAQAIPLEQSPAKITLEIGSVTWQKLKGFSNSGLHVEDRKLKVLSKNLNEYARMSGVVVNDSSYDLRSIEIDMVIFDAVNNPIAVNHSEIQTVRNAERRAVEVLWPRPFDGQAQNFVLSAQSNFFAEENFLTDHGTPQKLEKSY